MIAEAIMDVLRSPAFIGGVAGGLLGGAVAYRAGFRAGYESAIRKLWGDIDHMPRQRRVG